jgi:hypothetical protein
MGRKRLISGVGAAQQMKNCGEARVCTTVSEGGDEKEAMKD